MKVRKLVVTETDANGQRIKRPSTKWYGVFVDWSAALRRLPLLEDERASRELARTVGKPNDVRAGGDSMTADLAGLRRPTTDCKGIGAASFNYYLTAIKGFCRWAVKDGRASESPLEHLGGVNARTDRRHDRRALSADELRWLLDTTEHGPERFGMSGPERAMLYRLAVGSGLRANELRSLTRAGFALEGVEPTVTVGAAYSKHRREDVQPIAPDLAAKLREYLAGKMPNARAFDMPGESRVVKMFRADLADARTAWLQSHRTAQDASEGEGDTFLAYIDAGGRYADFHALRHSFISALASGGVHPKTAQTLARHSTITLTMDRYSHTYRGEAAAALSVLPDLSSPTSQTEKMTGTDGRLAGENPSCQNLVNPVSPPVSLEGAVSSSLVESCGVDKQISESAPSPGKTGGKRAFTGGKEVMGRGGIEPPTDRWLIHTKPKAG
ncbi:MAG: site-specific integrase [Planctomycetota bacterium]|nr:site-specific integrase [Planctomycetota bacterium]